MLDLKSEQWETLYHAYGKAKDVPAMLLQLETSPRKKNYDEEPWMSIWSALCHQGDIYSASLAAVPHIVRIAAGKPFPHRIDFIVFIATVEANFRLDANILNLPANILSDYELAISKCLPLATEGLGVALPTYEEWETRGLLGAIAIFAGKPRLGWAITDMEDEANCPECDAFFKLPWYEHKRE